MENMSFILFILGIIEEVFNYNFIKDFAPADTSISFMESSRLGIFRIQTIFAQPIVYTLFLIVFSAIILYLLSQDAANKKHWVSYILCCLNALLAF